MRGSGSGAELPQGDWHGHFASAWEPDNPCPTALSISLDGDAFSGAGEDADGAFEVRGVREGDALRWIKRYPGPDPLSVAYVGRWDAAAKELTGRWRVVHSGSFGRFSLRPGADPAFEGTEARARSFLRRRAKEWQALCSVDLEALRFDGERAVLSHLLADPVYVDLMRRVQTERAERDAVARRASLGDGRVRLRRAMVPGVFALLDRCVAALGLKAPVELYCVNDGAVNACVSVTTDRRVLIDITAGAINQLENAELLYVLGHELGHALLGHLETPRLEDGEFTELSALRSFALQRYEEVSADRVGLLCCDDLPTAVRAEFVLTTGIVNRAALGDPTAFLAYARQAVAALDAGGATIGEGYQTHPHGELRAMAIDLFARSETFHKLLGRTGGELTERALEREVARLVRLMNPSVVEAGFKGDDVTEFVLLGALSVASATGGVVAAERKALRKLGAGHAALMKRLEALPFEEQQVRLAELGEALVVTMPPAARTAIVDDLTVVARADGRISKGERAVLDGIAALLAVSEDGVGETLDALDAPLD